MLDPSAPGSAVFVAPDGGVYVDRNGVSERTTSRWRQAYDPETVRRLQRWRDVWAPLTTVAACVLPGALVGVVVARIGSVLALWEDTPAVGALGALLGLLTGCALTAVVLVRRSLVAVPPEEVVPVPPEIVAAAPADAAARDVWHWSTVVRREDRERRVIGYETYVERPPDRQRAEQAAARYRATHAEYVVVARSLGIVPREPAVDLDDPFTS